MNVPAIAKKTFDQLMGQAEFASIVNFVVKHLENLTSKIQKARFIHQIIDEYNEETFSHPLIKELSPCRMGCSACCYTQVSVTEEEAELLALRISEGVEIDHKKLAIQMQAGDSPEEFYKIFYHERKCIFLDDEGGCKVYEDRPSVCRTNVVLGDPSQCDTTVKIKPTRLVKTPKADMVIYASYLHSKSSGALANMVGKVLQEKKDGGTSRT